MSWDFFFKHNPDTVTPDPGFHQSPKASELKVAYDGECSEGLGVALAVHTDVLPGAPTAGSAQSIRASLSDFEGGTEHYGLMAYKITFPGAEDGSGAAAILVTINTTTTRQNKDGAAIVSEGAFPAGIGLVIHSSGPLNKYLDGIHVNAERYTLVTQHSTPIVAKGPQGEEVRMIYTDAGNRTIVGGEFGGVYLNGYGGQEGFGIYVNVDGRPNMRVTAGPPDSGGSGKRVLVIDN